MLRLKIGQIESSKWFVCEDIDSEEIEVFAGKIRQTNESLQDRGRGGNALLSGDDWKQIVA